MLFAPSVREELAFGPRNLGRNPQETERQISAALDLLGLQALLDRPPLSLSFGQQKRVGIASVLAMQSPILVMDEPTAGQDYASYTRFMDEVTRLTAFDAILFVTHDLDLALTYANRILLFYEGQIAADGSPEVVLADLDLLRRCHVLPTSLLTLNRELLPHTGRFLGLRQLATHLHTLPNITDVHGKSSPGERTAGTLSFPTT